MSTIEDDKPTEKNETFISCDYSPLELKYIKSIKWFKNNDTEVVSSENMTIVENKLKFSYLNHSIHNGLYNCQIELNTSQIITSTTTNLTVRCWFNSTILFKYNSLSFLFPFF